MKGDNDPATSSLEQAELDMLLNAFLLARSHNLDLLSDEQL